MKAWRITAAARADLLAIGRFTQTNWGRAQRQQYLEKLSLAFDRLAENPNLGRARHELLANFLSLPVGRHVIFYQRDPSGTVTIVRILHQSMDPTSGHLD